MRPLGCSDSCRKDLPGRACRGKLFRAEQGSHREAGCRVGRQVGTQAVLPKGTASRGR